MELSKDPMQRIKNRVRIDKNGCWNWLGGKDKDGYGKTTFKFKTYRPHRLAYAATYGPIPEGQLVLHKCDNPACCNPDHLFLGSQKDNIQDAIRKGRFKFNCNTNFDHLRGQNHYLNKHPEKRKLGEDCLWSKLKEEQVIEIRRLHKEQKISAYRLAKMFGVSKFCTLQIIRRKTWKHIE